MNSLYMLHFTTLYEFTKLVASSSVFTGTSLALMLCRQPWTRHYNFMCFKSGHTTSHLRMWHSLVKSCLNRREKHLLGGCFMPKAQMNGRVLYVVWSCFIPSQRHKLLLEIHAHTLAQTHAPVHTFLDYSKRKMWRSCLSKILQFSSLTNFDEMWNAEGKYPLTFRNLASYI